jgi:hypothetical protein
MRGMSSTSSPLTTTRTERLRSQLLTGPPARDAVAVCERLLAVQAQDPRGFRLAIRARARRPDVDAALERRELVVTWLNRGTLHLVRREDYPWLLALTAPRLLTANARRLQQEGVGDPEGAVRRVVRALEGGPLRRRDIALPRVPASGVLHVLFLAALRGLVVRGPAVGREQAYVLVADWLGPQPTVDRDAALRELGGRYLAAHFDADDRDLAKWSGLPLRDARAALRSTKPVTTTGFVDQPKLLGAFDEVLCGWADRAWVVGEHGARVCVGGLFKPTILVGGRVAGTWGFADGRVRLEPLEAFDERLLAGEVEAVERFLDR